jgi:hypothetical protein
MFLGSGKLPNVAMREDGIDHDITEILLKMALNTIIIQSLLLRNNNFTKVKLHVFTILL